MSDYTSVITKMEQTAPSRFWPKVRGNGATDCWEWTAAKDLNGYGMFAISRTHPIRAHVWAYTHVRGPVPEGLQFDHLCENTSCVNPWHLEAVTSAENTRRRAVSRVAWTRTFCQHGHPMTDPLIWTGRDLGTRRQCRECNRIKAAEWRLTPPEERQRRKAAGLPVVDLAAVVARQQAVAA